MIFYFSATGNTQWAAKLLAEATGERLVFIPDEPSGPCQYSLEEGERIGFCFPVHGWRPPIIVRKFVERLRITNGKGHFCYALCTAGDTIGEAMSIFGSDLAKVGIQLDSAYSLIMPESYVGLPFMDVDKLDKEKEKKQRAAEELKQLTRDILSRKKGVYKLTLGHWPKVNSRLIGGYFVSHLLTDKPFRVESSRCVKCGICVDVCPVHNIDGGLGYAPSWKHDGSCLTCFACYHHCPHHAIEFGNRTKKKGQYFYKRNKN